MQQHYGHKHQVSMLNVSLSLSVSSYVITAHRTSRFKLSQPQLHVSNSATAHKLRLCTSTFLSIRVQGFEVSSATSFLLWDSSHHFLLPLQSCQTLCSFLSWTGCCFLSPITVSVSFFPPKPWGYISKPWLFCPTAASLNCWLTNRIDQLIHPFSFTRLILSVVFLSTKCPKTCNRWNFPSPELC